MSSSLHISTYHCWQVLMPVMRKTEAR